MVYTILHSYSFSKTLYFSTAVPINFSFQYSTYHWFDTITLSVSIRKESEKGNQIIFHILYPESFEQHDKWYSINTLSVVYYNKRINMNWLST